MIILDIYKNYMNDHIYKYDLCGDYISVLT